MQENPATVALDFPKRPKVSEGFKARTINLVSNHFSLDLGKQQPSIYLYDVKILNTADDTEVAGDARILRRGIMRSADQKLRDKFGAGYWFSGQLLWSNKLHKELQTIETTFDKKKYAISIIKTRDISLRAETFQDNIVASPARQYLNILIKRYFNQTKFVEWGTNAKFYDPNTVNKLEEFYLEIYTGFKTSCEVYEGFKPKVLIDFSSRILRSDSALYYINAAKSSQEAREMLQGRSVVASYGNYRMYRIDDVDFKNNPTKTFTDDRGETTTLVDYYKKKYNIPIKDLKQPLLKSHDRRSGKEFLLVPELVQMTGLDDEMRANFKLMTEVAKYTRLDPRQRMQQIRSLSAPLSEYFKKQYDIVMDQTTSVQGLVLNPPQLTHGNGSFVPDRGNYQLRDPVFRPANFNKWLFVYSKACEQDAKYFLETLRSCAGAYAIGVSQPTKVAIADKHPNALKEAIKSNLKPDTQIVVAMYPPPAKKPWYSALKEVCYVEKGIPCQAVLPTSLKKNAMSVCSKILLQMNAKVGMELWMTSKPQGLPEKTMIIGADVFHSTKVGQELKSCIGFCASLNPGFNRFFSKVSLQNKIGEEIMNGVGKLVKEAVLKYFKFNNKKFLPECIIFFRDGVAENQLKAILEFETKAILEQLKTINPDYEPKFAEIVITKRIDDRIFATDATGQQRGGRGGSEPKSISNPPAGTVVANTIVSNNFDYLMVAQNVTQGTCTPTHYNVIYDTTGLPQEVFWELSYSQCFNYFNWNGSVRVPAPVQYAHKLAYLVGQTIRENTHANLDETLYYL